MSISRVVPPKNITCRMKNDGLLRPDHRLELPNRRRGIGLEAAVRSTKKPPIEVSGLDVFIAPGTYWLSVSPS